MSFNLHPRSFGSLKCEHGDCWNVNGRAGAVRVKLCRDHGVWALCAEHAAIVSIEHARLCSLPMRYSVDEYADLNRNASARKADCEHWIGVFQKFGADTLVRLYQEALARY